MGQEEPQVAQGCTNDGNRAAKASIENVIRFRDVPLFAVLPHIDPLGSLGRKVVGGIIILQSSLGYSVPTLKSLILVLRM